MVVAAAILLPSTAACGGDPAPETRSPGTQPSPAGSSAAGTSLAAGLYDLADGAVQAIGTVEYRDLEGGFWVVIGGTEAEGDAGTVVAVIANGADYADQFTQHRGSRSSWTAAAGRRLDAHGRAGDHGHASDAGRGGCRPGRVGADGPGLRLSRTSLDRVRYSVVRGPFRPGSRRRDRVAPPPACTAEHSTWSRRFV